VTSRDRLRESAALAGLLAVVVVAGAGVWALMVFIIATFGRLTIPVAVVPASGCFLVLLWGLSWLWVNDD